MIYKRNHFVHLVKKKNTGNSSFEKKKKKNQLFIKKKRVCSWSNKKKFKEGCIICCNNVRKVKVTTLINYFAFCVDNLSLLFWEKVIGQFLCLLHRYTHPVLQIIHDSWSGDPRGCLHRCKLVALPDDVHSRHDHSLLRVVMGKENARVYRATPLQFPACWNKKWNK